MASALFYLCLVFASLGGAPPAEVPPAEIYESQRSTRVLRGLGFEVEAQPEGKTIDFIRIVATEVFAEDEPYPVFLNAMRIRTREDVIERELLFSEGDNYRESLLLESTRNLRGMDIFSLVKLIPVRSQKPGHVGVVVFTRDLWSLRLEQAFQLTGSQIDQLTVQLTERNLLGRGKLAAVNFHLFPMTFSVGQLYSDRRVWGSQLSFFESIRFIYNRESGALEGNVGQLWFGKPLYSLGQSWSYGLSLAADRHVARQTQTGRVLPYDIPETLEEEEIPRAWSYRGIGASASVTRQYGVNWKQRLSAGMGAAWTENAPLDDAALSASQQSAFERDVLPEDSREVYPSLSYSFFKPSYYSFQNLSTFGKTEDVRVGPALGASLRLPSRALGSRRDSAFFGASAGYVYAQSSTLAQLAGSGSGELRDGAVINRVWSGLVRGATPHFLGFRFAARLGWTLRQSFDENVLISIGGNNGLRGYPSQAFQGYSVNSMLGSLELRSLPFVYRSVHTGLVAFYDAGSLYDEIEDLRLHQSVGLGARVLLPQLNRFAYRFDLGIPLDGRGFQVLLMIGRGQSLALTPADDALN